MVTTIEISEEFDVPGIEDPSKVEFQAKRMINTHANRHIVSGLKDAYRTFRINKDGKLEEKGLVHSSITGALNKEESGRKEWKNNSMSFEALLISSCDTYDYTHLIKGSDGTVESIELVSKDLANPDGELSEYHDVILGYMDL